MTKPYHARAAVSDLTFLPGTKFTMATKAARVANPPAKGEEKVKGAEGPTLIPPHQAAVDCALDNVTVPNVEFIPSVHVPQLEHPNLAPHLSAKSCSSLAFVSGHICV